MGVTVNYVNKLGGRGRRSCRSLCQMATGKRYKRERYTKFSDIYATQCWKCHPAIFLTIRILMAAYALGALITVCVMSIGNGDRSIMAYLTIWTFLLLTLHLCLAATVSCLYRPKPKTFLPTVTIRGIENPDFKSSASHVIGNTTPSTDTGSSIGSEHRPNIPWFLKLSWMLANVVQVFEVTVTIIYFGFLFQDAANRGLMINDMNMHALNTVFVLLDFCISARPIHLLHFLQPAVYGVLYILFSVIYWTQDHVNNVIYSVLDWNSPGFAVGLVCVLAFVIIPFFQLVYFGMFHLRLRIYKRIYEKAYFDDK